MIGALTLAFGQLSDPATRRVIWLGLLGAVLGFAGLAWGAAEAVHASHLLPAGWIDAVVSFLGGFAVIGLAWLLFPAVVIAISSLLLDQVVETVERQHYPFLEPPRRFSWSESILSALRFFAVVAVLNLLVLPLYLIPGANLVIFYGLNGYLLSREYFELVAFRRLDPPRAARMRRDNRMRLFLAGLIITFLSTVPIVNLLVPVVATAFMVHLFHAMAGISRRPAMYSQGLHRQGL